MEVRPDATISEEYARLFCDITTQLQRDDLNSLRRKHLLEQLDAVEERSGALRFFLSDMLIRTMHVEQPGSQILSEARASFPNYYERATEDDGRWMDALVMAWIGLTHAINCPREVVPSASRLRFEASCDTMERHFMKARDHVRGSATFGSLPERDQAVIAGVLFELEALDDESLPRKSESRPDLIQKPESQEPGFLESLGRKPRNPEKCSE